MTEANIFQLFGLIYLSMGLGWLISPRYFREMIDKMINNEAVLFVTGVLVLVLGYLVTKQHNIWNWDMGVFVTIIGWAAVLKGMMIIIIPELSIKLYKYILKRWMKSMTPYGVLLFVIGLLFAVYGYFVL